MRWTLIISPLYHEVIEAISLVQDQLDKQPVYLIPEPL